MAVKEIPYSDLKMLFRERERTRKQDEPPMVGYVVFTQDSFTEPYSTRSRTYTIYSNCKAFMPNMGGYSIFGSSLDGTDIDVRLDQYMADERGGKDGWKIEKCYIITND